MIGINNSVYYGKVMPLLFRFRIVIFIIFLSMLLYGLFTPNPPSAGFEGSDKVMHLAAFFGLGLISRFAFIYSPAPWVWGCVLASAPVLEYLQHYLQPSRSFSLYDAAANITGMLLALACWLLVNRRS